MEKIWKCYHTFSSVYNLQCTEVCRRQNAWCIKYWTNYSAVHPNSGKYSIIFTTWASSSESICKRLCVKCHILLYLCHKCIGNTWSRLISKKKKKISQMCFSVFLHCNHWPQKWVWLHCPYTSYASIQNLDTSWIFGVPPYNCAEVTKVNFQGYAWCLHLPIWAHVQVKMFLLLRSAYYDDEVPFKGNKVSLCTLI